MRKGSYLVSNDILSGRTAPQPARTGLSIIIVNYQTCKLTLECIESIYRHPPACTFEVILIDNASNDGIEGELRSKFPGVRFLESGENIGFARANNLGIHNSHGEYVMLLNSDARLMPDALSQMMLHMELNPDVGILGPRHVDRHGRFQLSCGKFPTLISEIARKIVYYRLSLNDYRVRDYLDGRYASGERVDWVSGSCMLIRRQVLYDIGLLDERFFMYFEDIDLCRRAQSAAWRVQYLPSVNVTHHGGASARQNLLTVMIENRNSQLHFGRKYYGFAGAALVRALLIVKYGLNLVRWTSLYCLHGLFGRATRRSYTMALLSKKVILKALTFSAFHPVEPALQPQKQNA